MVTQKVQMKEVLSWLVRWAGRAGTRYFCFALAALVDPVQNIFSSPYTVSIAQAGKAEVLGRQSLSICLWLRMTLMNVKSNI
jgi:hypothetical protein